MMGDLAYDLDIAYARIDELEQKIVRLDTALSMMQEEVETGEVLMRRAEAALDWLSEWYCSDVECEACRVKGRCSKTNIPATVAYAEVVRLEADE